MGIKKEGKIVHKEEKAIAALKRKMSKMKVGSKEHKAAMRKMKALKGSLSRKVKAAAKAGMKKGIRKESKIVKKEKKLLSQEDKAMRALKRKMKGMKKGS